MRSSVLVRLLPGSLCSTRLHHTLTRAPQRRERLLALETESFLSSDASSVFLQRTLPFRSSAAGHGDLLLTLFMLIQTVCPWWSLGKNIRMSF